MPHFVQYVEYTAITEGYQIHGMKLECSSVYKCRNAILLFTIKVACNRVLCSLHVYLHLFDCFSIDCKYLSGGLLRNQLHC